MSKHTPAPWEYSTVKLADWYTRIGHCVNIGEEDKIRLYGKEAEANARLIASAPELLEALEAFCDMQGRLYGNATQTHIEIALLAKSARVLIAKAEGK
jgi:hypothetical protein